MLFKLGILLSFMIDSFDTVLMNELRRSSGVATYFDLFVPSLMAITFRLASKRFLLRLEALTALRY